MQRASSTKWIHSCGCVWHFYTFTEAKRKSANWLHLLKMLHGVSLASTWKNNTFIPHCCLSEALQTYYHFQTRIPWVPVSKPSKSPALIPIFLPKTSIRRIALLLLLPLGANLFLPRWKLSVPTKLLTHSQWRCQFSRPRHCGLDNLIGEARRCVPGRCIQMLYRRLSQRWLLSCCGDSGLNSPSLFLSPAPPLPSSMQVEGGVREKKRETEFFVGAGGKLVDAA